MALLECDKLSISFGGLVAIDQVDFSIHQGEVVGLIGPNGSGKTTFFNLISGIYRPRSGKVFFKNQSLIGRLPAEVSRMGMSRTFQRSRLFLELSVLDNVLSGMCYHAHSGLLDALFRKKRLLGTMETRIEQAATLLNYFSNEMGASLNKKAGDLPLADRRRLEICRALANDPDLLLLDEPSAGMDPEETRILMEDIEKAMKRKPEIGIIIIEHDLTVIQGIAHRVVVLNYGQKIAEGPFRRVAEDPVVRQAYLGKVEIRA